MPAENLASRKVLITGAAGKIGSAFVEHAGHRYDLRLADRTPIESSQHETRQFDVADPEACRSACDGVDTVVHLAGDPSPNQDFYDSLLDSNIKGTYNIFRAAQDAGCRRVIFASSAQAVESYPPDTQVHPGMPVRPRNLYGVSKCFGEALAAYFAFNKGLSSIAIRIGAFEFPEDHETMSARDLSAFLSPTDFCHLLVQCIETSNVQFAIAHGVSDNRFKRLDLSSTRRTFGYEPQDDAFSIYEVPLKE